MKNVLCLPVGAFILCGCVTHVQMPVLPATHPANPLAESGLLVEPSGLLLHHLPPPDTKPIADPDQHDHMQQQGHAMSGNSSMSDMGKGAGNMGRKDREHGALDKKKATHKHSTELQEPATGPMTGKAQSGRVYRCPVHTGETSYFVGNCPKCGQPMAEKKAPGEGGMQSESRGNGAQQSEPSYFCTMHAQLSLDSPGLCPVCGMTLIERKEEGK